jgi:hypothetical protein
LNLNNNKLTGAIPAEIGNLTNLTSLILGANQLTGSIPAEIGNLTNLIDMSLSNNQLTGAIPAEIGNLTNLTGLGLGFNQLTGPIPAEIGNFTKLEILELQDNHFFDLPNLSALSLLHYLSINNNKFTFEDIEPNVGVTSNFSYAPQDSVGEYQNITINQDDSLQISVTVGGAHNIYQWFKDGINVDSANDSTYTINSANITDSGVYACEIKNSVATALALYSRPIIVKVQSAPGWVMSYDSGWNMVSLGLEVEDKSMSSVFPPAISLFKFDNGYQTANALEVGKGYWVNLGSPMNETIYGEPINEFSLNLPAKWSMIGALSCSVSVADFVQAPPNNIVSIYAFNGTQYVPVYPGGSGVLEQGKGYWINMGASGSIQMSAPSGTGKVLAAVSAQPELLRGSTEIPITITASGTNQTVSFYLVEHAPWEEKLNQTFELPPPSPLGMLDVRIFGENSNGYRSLVVDSQGDFTKTITLTVPEGSGGIEANWKNDSLVRGACLLSDGRQTVDMAEVNRITVDGNTKQLTLIYSGEGTEASPMAYSLQANYPNPFNPETTIPYTIKDAGMVELTVFNVLGQEVKRLVYEVKQPGIHSTRWDGTDAYGKLVSGGIYLYRMSVNGFIETRKMLLMK